MSKNIKKYGSWKQALVVAGWFLSSGFSIQASILNEWGFGADPAGRTLSEAVNAGSEGVSFTPGNEGALATDGLDGLVCTPDDSGTDGMWTHGAILDATLSSTVSTGVRYLRYDFSYDLTDSDNLNDSGGVVGFGFYDDSGDKVVGLGLSCDANPSSSSVYTVTKLAPLSDSGTIAVVAKIDLNEQEISVWYDLTGDVSGFSESSPTTNVAVSLTSFDSLRFQSTGDIRPAGSTDEVTVDLLRTADSWFSIVADEGVFLPNLQIAVTAPASMEVGDSDVVSIVISNDGNLATAVTSTLSHDGALSAFTIVSNNTPASLASGASLTNTYERVANADGTYTFSAQEFSAETHSAATNFIVAVGSLIDYLSNSIVEVSGGLIDGQYEPGETIDMTVVSTNKGAIAISNIVNSLSTVSAGFTITPAFDTYTALDVGESTSSVYRVVIGATLPAGTYTFDVTNRAGNKVWSNRFPLEVFIRQPGTDWVKADNSDDLDQASSWVDGLVPDATDLAVMDATVTSDMDTDLGSDLEFRGIVLSSNAVSWTISGTNTMTLGSAGIDMSAAGNDLIVSTPLVLNSSAPLDVVTSQTLTLSGDLTWDHPEPLVKKGAGTLALGGDNIYTSGTIVSNGTLSVGSDDALGTGAVVVDNAALGTTAAAALANDIELIGNALVVHNDDLTFDGILSGFGSLTKTGSGTLILNGENTYSGGTTNFGKIELGNAGALGSGPVIMEDGTLYASVLNFYPDTLDNNIVLAGGTNIFQSPTDTSERIEFNGDISGSGSLELQGYEFCLRGNNTFSGGLILRQNSYLRFEDGSLGTGPLITTKTANLLALSRATITNSIVMNDTLALHLNSQDVSLEGKMSGSGILQIAANTWGTLNVLSDNSGRTGETRLFASAIRAGHPNAFGSGRIWFWPNNTLTFGVTKDLVLANDFYIYSGYLSAGKYWPLIFDLDHDLEITGTFTKNVDYEIDVIKTGPGTLTLSGPATFTQPVDVNAGSLVVNTAIFDSERVTVASGAMLDLQAVPSFSGDLSLDVGSQIRLSVVDDISNLNGTGDLALAGTLTLDFVNYSGANSPITAGDIFTVIDVGSWSSVTDNGLSVLAEGLPPYMTIDASLFVNGTVEIVASRLRDQSLTITVPAGMTAEESITLTNASGGTLGFTIRNNGTWLPGDYGVVEQDLSRENFYLAEFEPNTVFDLWNGSVSEELPIGFEMPVFATTYTSFEVSQDGFVMLKNGAGESAVMTPFQTGTPVAQESVRYQSETERLVISWTLDTGLECQVWLNADGTIQYLYQYGAWSEAGIRLQNDAVSQSITHTPGTSQYDSLLLTPTSWVASDPEADRVAAGGSQIVTFTADASAQVPGEYFFSAPFVWSDGEVVDLAIFVLVTDQTPHLELPAAFAFSGSAGWISHSWMTLSNSGNYGLDYTITDSGLQDAGYAWTNIYYGWQHIPDDVVDYILAPDQLGSRVLEVGFPFVYFGNTYTSLVVNLDGTLSLGDGQSVSPFGSDLSVNGNPSVRFLADPGFNRFTVTWQNIDQFGGSSDQTFQAVLNYDGTIRFNYQSLGDGWTNGLIRLADPSGTVTAMLEREGATVFVKTNIVTETTMVTNWITIGGDSFPSIEEGETLSVTNVVTTYAETANNQSLLFTPGASRMISASPVNGTIPAGAAAEIKMTADARGMDVGETAQAVFTFNYSGQTADVGVTFTATNGVAPPSPAEIKDMWGGDPEFTHQKNPAGSVMLTWTAADDGLPRTYKVWFTTRLSEGWTWLATVLNGTVYIDSEHKDEPVIYYKITAE